MLSSRVWSLKVHSGPFPKIPKWVLLQNIVLVLTPAEVEGYLSNQPKTWLLCIGLDIGILVSTEILGSSVFYIHCTYLAPAKCIEVISGQAMFTVITAETFNVIFPIINITRWTAAVVFVFAGLQIWMSTRYVSRCCRRSGWANTGRCFLTMRRKRAVSCWLASFIGDCHNAVCTALLFTQATLFPLASADTGGSGGWSSL